MSSPRQPKTGDILQAITHWLGEHSVAEHDKLAAEIGADEARGREVDEHEGAPVNAGTTAVISATLQLAAAVASVVRLLAGDVGRDEEQGERQRGRRRGPRPWRGPCERHANLPVGTGDRFLRQ